MSISGWTTTLDSGIAIPGITENIHQNLVLYPAAWRVRYYNKDGDTLLHTEYVIDGEDATWGASEDWSNTPEGEEVSGILTNISANLDVYSTMSTLLHASAQQNVLAEAFSEHYVTGQTDWDGLVISSGASVLSDGALDLPGNKYVSLSSVPTSRTFYGVVQRNGTYSWGGRIICSEKTLSAGYCASFVDVNSKIYYSYYGGDVLVSGDITQKHVYAISSVKGGQSKFYFDGVYQGSLTCTDVGDTVMFTSNGSNYINGALYYAAVVSGEEDQQTIITNMQSIMQHYRISGT